MMILRNGRTFFALWSGSRRSAAGNICSQNSPYAHRYNTNTSPIPAASTPAGNCGAFAHIFSPGGRALAYPRATPRVFDTLLVSDLKSIMEDFVGKRPLVFRRSIGVILCIFALVIKLQLEISLSINCNVIVKDQREYVFLIHNVRDDFRGEGGAFALFFVPIPRHLPPKTKKKG